MCLVSSAFAFDCIQRYSSISTKPAIHSAHSLHLFQNCQRLWFRVNQHKSTANLFLTTTSFLFTHFLLIPYFQCSYQGEKEAEWKIKRCEYMLLKPLYTGFHCWETPFTMSRLCVCVYHNLVFHLEQHDWARMLLNEKAKEEHKDDSAWEVKHRQGRKHWTRFGSVCHQNIAKWNKFEEWALVIPEFFSK